MRRVAAHRLHGHRRGDVAADPRGGRRVVGDQPVGALQHQGVVTLDEQTHRGAAGLDVGRSSVAVTAAASRSTTRRTPPSTVTSRVPSVQARSGSPTPCSWVLVVERPTVAAGDGGGRRRRGVGRRRRARRGVELGTAPGGHRVGRAAVEPVGGHPGRGLLVEPVEQPVAGVVGDQAHVAEVDRGPEGSRRSSRCRAPGQGHQARDPHHRHRTSPSCRHAPLDATSTRSRFPHLPENPRGSFAHAGACRNEPPGDGASGPWLDRHARSVPERATGVRAWWWRASRPGGWPRRR